jgi:hypothetical protein
MKEEVNARREALKSTWHIKVMLKREFFSLFIILLLCVWRVSINIKHHTPSFRTHKKHFSSSKKETNFPHSPLQPHINVRMLLSIHFYIFPFNGSQMNGNKFHRKLSKEGKRVFNFNVFFQISNAERTLRSQFSLQKSTRTDNSIQSTRSYTEKMS